MYLHVEQTTETPLNTVINICLFNNTGKREQKYTIFTALNPAKFAVLGGNIASS